MTNACVAFILTVLIGLLGYCCVNVVCEGVIIDQFVESASNSHVMSSLADRNVLPL